jgi:S1-C subfamily serine protease
MIWATVPNGSAAAAGLRGLMQTEDGDVVMGDIITSIDGEKIKDRDDLFRTLDKHQINDVVRVDILREGRRITIPVRLLEAPDARRNPFRR